MKPLSSLLLGVALTASCLTAAAGPYEARVLIKTLKVTGSPAPGTGTGTPNDTGNTPTPPPPAVTSPLQVNPTTVNFGAGITGQTSDVATVSIYNPNSTSVQVSNISMDDATKKNFGQDNDCGTSLAANSSCNLYVSMTPSQTGTLSGQVTIVGGGRTTTVGLNGSAVAATRSIGNSGWTSLTAEPGRPSTGSVSISNTGNSPVTISAISTETPYFSVASTDCGGELAVNNSCTVNIQFAPNQEGPFNDKLTIQSNATNNTPLELTGEGIAPQPHLDQMSGGYFGTPYVNTTDSTTVVFQNTGQVLTKVGTLSYEGTGGTTALASTVFKVTSDTCTGAELAPGATCNVVVALTGKQEPTAYSLSIYPKYGETGTESTSYGYAGGSFRYMSTALTATNFAGTFNSTGTDTTPVAFQSTGGTSQRTFTLASRDSAPGTVTVTSTNAAEFALSSNTCLGSLAPAKSCSFVVTFKPASGGPRNGQLVIGGTTKMSVNLTGN